MNPAFIAAYQGGTNFANSFREARETRDLDTILKEAMSTNDPARLQQTMGKILSSVSPAKQPMAMRILESKMGEIDSINKRERINQAYDEAGIPRSEQNLPPTIQAQREKAREGERQFQNIVGQPNQSQQMQEIAQNESIYRQLSEDQLVQATGISQYSKPASEELRRRQQEVKANRSNFEPESEKLEAKRVSELATQIEKEYSVAKSEDIRLERMEKLSDNGEVSTPVLIKTLDAFGLPIGILQNPDTEEYRKLETDFIRDARDIFPGGRITNYEIQSYLKTIPTLLNSKEGRQAIIRNRKLLNEGKKVKYEEYKKILSENKGRKPQNLGILLEERTADRISEIEDRFKNGIEKEIGKIQTPIRMIAPDGEPVDIPPHLIEQAMKDGARF